MSENKEIKFVFKIDEAAAQRAKAVITDLIQSATQLARVFQGGGFGGSGLPGARPGGGGLQPSPWLSGSVGGSTSGQQLINQAASRPGVQQQGGIASIFLAGADSLKSFANMSTGAMRMLSDNVRRAVDEQKRSLADLDNQLEKVVKQYERLKNSEGRQAAGTSGVTADTMHELAGDSVRLAGERDKARAGLQTLQGQQEALDKAMNPGGGGGGTAGGGGAGLGWAGRMGMTGLVGGTRWGAMGALALAGATAAGKEYLAGPTDFLNQEVRHAQTFKRMGMNVRQGDLSWLMAMKDIAADQGQLGARADFLKTVNKWSTVADYASAPLSAVGSGLIQGNVNAPGAIFRAIEGIPADQKQRLMEQITKRMETDPTKYWMLQKFQGESLSRSMGMRQMGWGEESYTNIKRSLAGTGIEPEAMFGAVRGGGRGWAAQAIGTAISAARGGMNVNVAGDLMIAAAPGGATSGLMRQVVGGLDVVAGENLMRGLAGAIQGSTFGPGTGWGLGTAMNMGLAGMSSQMQTYEAGQRAQSLPAMSALLGGTSDPFGAGINILAATQVTGAGGDLYKANALAQLAGDPATLFDAMRGGKEFWASPAGKALSAMGITSGDAKSMFQAVMSGQMRGRNISQSGDLSPSSMAVERLNMVYGGDVGAYMTGEGAGLSPSAKSDILGTLAAGVQARMPGMFKTVPEAKGALGMMANVPEFGGMTLGGLPGDASWRSNEAKYAREKGQTEEETYRTFKATEAEFLKQMGSMDWTAMGKGIEGLGAVNVSAKDAAASLIALTEAARITARQALGGKVTEAELLRVKNLIEPQVTKEIAVGEAPSNDKPASRPRREGIEGMDKR